MKTSTESIALTALAAILTLAGCTEAAPEESDSVDLLAVRQALTEAAAVLAALEHVSALPENTAPVQQGSRTFETSGAVIVYHDREWQAERDTPKSSTPTSLYSDVEAGVRSKSWTLATGDPRECTDLDDRSNWDFRGDPTCVLAGDSNALLLEWERGESVEHGYQVRIVAHRNRAVPYDPEALAEINEAMAIEGSWRAQELTEAQTGVAADGRPSVAVVDETTYWSEYDRVVTAVEAGPGVLGWVRYVVHVDPHGAVSHLAVATSRPGLRHIAPLAWSH